MTKNASARHRHTPSRDAPHRIERWLRPHGRIAVAGIVVALVLGIGSGAAWAYFSGASASATASGRVGHAPKLIVVRADGSPTTKLQPGSTADLLLELKNFSHSSVTIVSIGAGTGPIKVDRGGRSDRRGGDDNAGRSDCTPSNAGVSVNSKSGLSITVPPGSHLVSVTGGAHMATSSANACQGAFFHLPVKVTVAP